MIDSLTHLSEEERQCLADGTLVPARIPDALAHLRSCESCAEDVARIERLMKRVRETPPPTAELSDLWPDIRARLEHSKVVPLNNGGVLRSPTPSRHHFGVWLASAAGIAATTVVVLAYRERPIAPAPTDDTASANVSFIAASDSAREYQDQAQVLLNDLELKRSMLRPETAKVLDEDLRAVDNAIAELEDAIAHDPTNGVLRQLLASSYRQKVDLLTRVNNAS